MENLTWGLMMMLVGMGVVFALLAALMALLLLIGRLDRQPREAPAAMEAPPVEERPDPDAAPHVRIVADGLDEDQVAAITVAVITHAENRRRLAAPETRAHAPGSQLFASRWLAVGRAQSQQPFVRR